MSEWGKIADQAESKARAQGNHARREIVTKSPLLIAAEKHRAAAEAYGRVDAIDDGLDTSPLRNAVSEALALGQRAIGQPNSCRKRIDYHRAEAEKLEALAEVTHLLAENAGPLHVYRDHSGDFDTCKMASCEQIRAALAKVNR